MAAAFASATWATPGVRTARVLPRAVAARVAASATAPGRLRVHGGLAASAASFASSSSPFMARGARTRADAFAIAAKRMAKQTKSPNRRARAAAASFRETGLDDELCAATDALGLETPTDIQSVAIPRILRGGNYMIASHTGSGKTLTYLLPIIHRIRREENATVGGGRARPKRPRVLVVSPTRELAEQVAGVAKSLSHHARFSSALVIGGDKFATQRSQLDRSLAVVVGTPGRLVKHVKEGNMYLGRVTHVVLDEADTLFEAGFGDDIRVLLGPLQKKPEGKSCVIVSATMSDKVVKTIEEDLPGIEKIDTPSLHRAAPNLKHKFVDCPGSIDKMAVVTQLIEGDFRAGKKTMVFANTMPSCQAVEYALVEAGLPVVMYNGDMTSEKRAESMEAFVSGAAEDNSLVVMVCTDLAARGLDFGGDSKSKVDHVVNFDFPMNAVDYLHRSGRTARAGAPGKVTNLVAKKDRVLAGEIDVAVKLGNPLDGATSSKIVAEARLRKEILARKAARAIGRGGRGESRGGRGRSSSRGGRGGRGGGRGASAGGERVNNRGRRGAARFEEAGETAGSGGGRGGGRGGRGRRR